MTELEGFGVADFYIAAQAFAAAGMYLTPLARQRYADCGVEVQRRHLYRHRLSKRHAMNVRRLLNRCRPRGSA